MKPDTVGFVLIVLDGDSFISLVIYNSDHFKTETDIYIVLVDQQNLPP